jgi:hypothetical protein
VIRHVRLLLFIVVGGVFATLVLRLSLNNLLLTRSDLPKGCPGATTNGSVDPLGVEAFYDNQTLQVPVGLLADSLSGGQKAVLGLSTGEEKWIEVDLSDQKLIAHQGDRIILESLISSGLTNPTPVGEYHIWYKIRSTLMEGGSKLTNTYYYLPNVPYAMFFYQDYSIHGTYWHSNFGHPMSHGCVNAPTPVAEKLFYWVDPQLPAGKLSVRATADNPGIRVVVHE